MEGRLVYVVGASGAGKDSLIRYAREALGGTDRVVFAHRYITRPSSSGGENHIELTGPEFAKRKRLGLFAMTWDSHGYRYGLGIEIDAWLAKGLTVIVNGSRGYVPSARRRYPRISVVWISVAPQVLAARLKARGRESPAEIRARLARNAEVGLKPPRRAVEINNDGALDVAGRQLVQFLTAAPA
jgi:ribose 1,5-bisphosphokinase